MKVLDRKLLRELWGMRGPAVAIAMVITSGVATFVMSLSTLHSLQETRAAFYDEYRFAEVFATVKRAPEGVTELIREIPGVQAVETRVIGQVVLDIEDFADPVTGTLKSIDESGEALLNRTYLRRGRDLDPSRSDEVMLSEAFADAHGFDPGDSITAIVNGRRQQLSIAGIALSPEDIYSMAPGGIFPDFERYGVLWMGREGLANALDMDGAFNHVALTLAPGTPEEEVIGRLDEILERYGGLGAYGRADQISHRYLSEEFRQLRLLATIFPVIFMSVAAFLLNVVVSRLVRTQRQQIATLKAFGYTDLAVLVHYVKMISVIVVLGVIAGIGAGAWLGQGMARMYMTFYKFPYLRFEIGAWVIISAGLISLAAAWAGTLYSVWQAVREPPAEAMRPEAPASYRVSLVERLGLKRWLTQPTRMILRHIERRPVKSLMSIVGVAFALAILMVGMFFQDAVDVMIQVQYGFAQREDMAVAFVEPTSYRAYYELLSLPGVQYGEVFRSVPVDLRFEHRRFRTAIQGIEPDGDLGRLIDTDLAPVSIPAEGIVLTDYLAEVLGVGVGDTLTLEIREGSRPVHRVPISALVSEYIGVSVYMQRAALNRLMGEGDAISGAYLATDDRYESDIFAALEEMPRVAGTIVQKNAIESFYETAGNQLLTFALINTVLAGSIAVGVVYNTARVALSERNRELASLRVLGFRRAEVSYILLGELAVLTLVAIPVGFLIGRALCAYMIATFRTDLFRIPLIIDPSTYSYSAAVVVVAAAISGFIVRRRIDRLDLVAVLKERE
jgi:putative ABC transport system permease protein